MSDLLLNYDQDNYNKFLPNSLRTFCQGTNALQAQDFQTFIPMFEGVERLAVFNNRIAAEVASGITDLNFTCLRSGAAPRLLDIVVGKAVRRIWYQVSKDREAMFNEKMDSDYFSDCLYKAFTEAAMTGRSLVCLYGSGEDKSKDLDIVSYNLFRHKIRKVKNKIKEAWIYIVKVDTETEGLENVICEHRFYKKGVAYQEFLVYNIDYTSSKIREKANVSVIETENIPDKIKEAYPDVVFNRAVKLSFQDLGVYDVRYSKINKKFLDSDIPEAMFIDSIDNAAVLDTTLTDKEVEKEIGRGQILMPSFESEETSYIDPQTAGTRTMRTLSVQFRNPVISKYPTMSVEDSKPSNVQFDIRSEQWITQLDSDVVRLCASVGVGVIDFMPTLLGGQQRTDDEINSMTDLTASTVSTFRDINQYEINQMLTMIAHFFGIEEKVYIRWSMSSIINPTKNTDLVTRQFEAGFISRKEAIRRVNPDLSQKEVDDLYNDVMAERGAEAVENRFNEF